MGGKACHIAVQPFGPVPPRTLAVIREALEEAFPCRTDLRPEQPVPPTAWMAARRQYDSTHLILCLEASAPAGDTRVVGVLDEDLCSPIMTFVFGEAELDGRFCVLSLHRLRQEVYGLPPDEALLDERAAKEAVHETAHTFGLRHCFRSHCIMHPSDTVEVTDIKSIRFCQRCQARLDAAVEKRNAGD